MTPQQPQVVLSRPQTSFISQRVQLTHKLFLLEKARTTLEQDLLNFTSKAYDEVQGFLNSPFPTKVFTDLAKDLDLKCQTVKKLSAILKQLPVDGAFVTNGVRTNKFKPLRHKGIITTDVLKFGPMLYNSFMSNSIAKAVQVLGASLSLQDVLISQPAAIQQNDMMCNISSSHNGTFTTRPSSNLEIEGKEHGVALEAKRPPDAPILPPVNIQNPKISAERPPPPLLPPLQAILPENSNPIPMKITPIISWGCENDVQVQHQKQTSSQLLHFLRAKAKNMGALEVAVMECSRSTSISSSTQSMSPTMRTQSKQLRHVAADDLIEALSPKMLLADIENQAPVFRVKKREMSGFLTYTCVIATKTELWDFGDIFTEVGQEESEANPLENNNSAEVQKTQIPECPEPQQESSSAGAKTPAINIISIPEFQIRRFEETEVVVSHIVSPDSFYIQHADSMMKLQALVTDSWKGSPSYAEQNCIPDIGTQVMGWFPKQEQWCRAQVTKICGVTGGNDTTAAATGTATSIKVEVKRLDHGDTACISLLYIKELTQDLAVLPLQAMQVSLANVTPVNGNDWSEEAVGWFQAMVHNRTLYARIYPQGTRVTVELFFEKGKLGAMRRGASLSVRLAQNGHAMHKKLKNSSVMQRSTVQVRMKEQDSEWEKYLISCYTQIKK